MQVNVHGRFEKEVVMVEAETPYVWINETFLNGRPELREIRFKPAKGHRGVRLVGRFSIANAGPITLEPAETATYTRAQLEALGEIDEEDDE